MPRFVTWVKDILILFQVLYQVLVKEPTLETRQGRDNDRRNQVTYLDSYLAACKCDRCCSM